MLCYGTKICYVTALKSPNLDLWRQVCCLFSLVSTTVSIAILIFVNSFQNGEVLSSDFSDYKNVTRNYTLTTLV
jgi:hypothetical protein